MNNEKTRCGYIAIVGRPNVGKSTLINKIMKQKISITAGKPQTTRHQILAVKTEGACQAIYVDTPGIHQNNKTEMNKHMNKAAWSVLDDVDAVLFVVDRTKWTEMESNIAKKCQALSCPVFVAINKVDHLSDKSALLPVLAEMQEKISAQGYFPISAKTGDGVAELEAEITKILPESPFYFGEEDKTNRQQSFQLAEIVREKIIRFLGDELPHASTVQIESMQLKDDIMHIHALIWVERDSQKKIIIGKDGATLKRISTEARQDCEKLLGKKVMLRTWVKVKKDWRDDQIFMKSTGVVDE